MNKTVLNHEKREELRAYRSLGFRWVIFDGRLTTYCTCKPGPDDEQYADRPEAVFIDDILKEESE